MEKKNSWAVIISCISLAVALVCVLIVFCKSKEMGGVIDLGTFVGICVGLIGVCATIMVGLQIWNHIEFQKIKDKITAFEHYENEIQNSKTVISHIRKKFAEQIGNAFTAMSRGTNDKKLYYAYMQLHMKYGRLVMIATEDQL